jgi:hypothetical protein
VIFTRVAPGRGLVGFGWSGGWLVTSIERTAYPQFKRVVSARELCETFTPTVYGVGWARDKTRSDQHFLTLVVLLKAFGRLGYFPDLFEVPIAVVEHVRGVLELKPELEPGHDSDRTLRHHKGLIRIRLGIVAEPERARSVAEAAIRGATATKDNPADLINVALEELVRARLELPGYSTLDEMTAEIRAEVNAVVFASIAARMSGPDASGLDAMLVVDPVRRRSDFDRVKTVAGAATVGKLKEHVEHLRWLDAVGPTEVWLADVPPAKVSHFAGKARVTDAADLARYGMARRQALIACLVHTARVRTRDDIAAMFCKRLAAIHKNARERLEVLQAANRAESERLLETFGEVLAVVREALDVSVSGDEQPGTAAAMADAVYARAGRLVLGALEQAGGVGALSTAHEEVTAHHGNNYLPFVEKFYRGSCPALFQVLEVLDFQPISADKTVAAAAAFLRVHRGRTGEHLPTRVGETEVDLSFASEKWRRIIFDARRPGRMVRRHFEACVFSYLASELRSGDMAVVGSESYANLGDQLLSAEECEPLVAAYCAEAGLPADAAGAVAELRVRLEQAAQRGILDVLTHTAYRTGWTRHFWPASGSDPKIKNAMGRYVLLTFTYGANLGPAQVARHMHGRVLVHELATASKHADSKKINAASADVINAHAQLDLTLLWGDGSRVGADGTQMDTWSDNLLAESHIRYGGYGGIAYRHIADNYIALFSHFIPCGVWEAVYILQGLLDNNSDVQPTEIHADTQG